MKFKKILSAALAFTLIFAVGCGKTETQKNEDKTSSEEKVESIEIAPVEQNNMLVNPLTGVKDMNPAFENKRPVAVMVNNINIAQSIQCGIGKADIVYETEVESGITRLMAVYKDITKVQQLGSIRSARFDYIDLAMGHNAVYCHHGQDPVYAAPHLKDAKTFIIDETNAGKRISNGKPKEHTLYTFGDKLWNYLNKENLVNLSKPVPNWQNFAEDGENIDLGGQVANTVYVPFTGASKTNFVYDTQTQKYTRQANGVTLKDYKTGEVTQVKNVFVLMTSIKNHADNKHRDIRLSGGDGFYAVNEKYIPIKWTKGNANNPVKITNADGSTLTVNAGNSWVCLANTATCTPKFS